GVITVHRRPFYHEGTVRIPLTIVTQGCVKVGRSTLRYGLPAYSGCGVEPFTPFDTRSARGTLWVQDAHFCDFDVALIVTGDVNNYAQDKPSKKVVSIRVIAVSRGPPSRSCAG